MRKTTKTFRMKDLALGPKKFRFGIKNSLSKQHLGFLANYSNHNTQKVVSSNLNDFIQFVSSFGHSLQDVDQDIVNLFLNDLRGRKLSNAAYNLKLSNVKKYLEYMGKRGLIYKTAPANPYGAMDIISQQDFNSIIKYLNEMKGKQGAKMLRYQRDYILFNLLFLTGLRKDEALNLKYSDLKIEGEGVYYRAKLKGGKEIKKQLPDSLNSQLSELKKVECKGANDYIFTSNYKGGHKKLSHFTVNKNLNKYHQIVNNKTAIVTVHGIRNLSGWVVYKLTKDILKVKEHLNHKNLNTTYIYLSKMENMKIDYYPDMETALINGI